MDRLPFEVLTNIFNCLLYDSRVRYFHVSKLNRVISRLANSRFVISYKDNHCDGSFYDASNIVSLKTIYYSPDKHICEDFSDTNIKFFISNDEDNKIAKYPPKLKY